MEKFKKYRLLSRWIMAVFSLFISMEVSGQSYNRDTICDLDTIEIVIGPHKIRPKNRTYPSGIYKAFYGWKNKRSGIKLDVGRTQFYYNKPTRNLIGNHAGLYIGLIAFYNNWNFGIRFKPWTVTPKGNLIFNNDTLTGSARLNPVKLDYFFGYSINVNSSFTIEPYVGYSRAVFKVINEKEINKKFKIPTSRGFVAGITGNKYYFNGHMALFGSIGYSSVNFRETHPQLKRGYLEWTMGFALKARFAKTIYKPLRYVRPVI